MTLRAHLDELLRRRFGVEDPLVLRLAALTVEAAVDGHAALDLAALPDVELEVARAALAASPAVRVAVAPEGPADAATAAVPPDEVRPFVLEGDRLATDREHRAERRVVAGVARRAGRLAALEVGAEVAADDPDQRAAVTALLGAGRTAGIGALVGGPGTGKTTTVAALVAAVLAAAPEGGPAPRVALAAPTGRAAARLREAVHGRAAAVAAVHGPRIAEALTALSAVTVHRLLGLRAPRLRRSDASPLPYDLVIVDEASMLPLPLAAVLLEALPPTAQLVFVGDPDQLESVETGAVLGALVAGLGPTGAVVRLRRSHRDIGAAADRVTFAAAVRAGDADAALEVLRRADGAAGLRWVATDRPHRTEAAVLDPVLGAGDAGGLLGAAAAARAGDAVGALTALADVRLLCAHREGVHGVAHWTARLRARLVAAGAGPVAADGWFEGEPVQVLANDRAGLLANGDVGVVVGRGAARRIVFDIPDPAAPDPAGPDPAAPEQRLARPPALAGPLASALAVTVHRGQGSEYGTVVTVLPPATSPLASRELLYTAVTRAQRLAVVVGDEAAVRACITRPAARVGGLASGLRALAGAGRDVDGDPGRDVAGGPGGDSGGPSHVSG